MQELLSRTECSVLRGVAIIGIFLHNFCHWLNPVVKENEYQYFQSNVDWFIQVMARPDMKWFAHVVSFFGHYGVPVFLFLSAYGLVMKYEREDAPTVALPSFVGFHFKKLFKMMIVGYVAFTMFDMITPGHYHYEHIAVLGQLGLFNNLLDNPDRMIWPGPYWFFGLMIQLYIVYRLFLYRKGWKPTVALIVICWLLQVFCDPEGETLNRLRYNFIGGMLPFGLGLLYARYGKVLSYGNNVLLMISSALFVVAFSFSYQTWYWVPLFVCTFSVGFVKALSKVGFLMNILSWVGGISAALFVCHPITRKIFIPLSRGGDIYGGLLLYIMASICLAWVFRLLLRQVPSPKLKS